MLCAAIPQDLILIINGQNIKLQIAHFKLSYSRAFILRAYPLQTHEMLFDAHNHAFDILGGIPERGIYDNMKNAVDRVGRGMAYDGERVFAAINQIGTNDGDPDLQPSLNAIDASNGEVLWSFKNSPDCSGDRLLQIASCGTNYGLSAATLLVDGAVVQGGNDGYLRIFDPDSGELIFSFDTARKFETINGIEGHGGSIDNAVIVAANGLLLVQSGYGLLGAPGNVLLAFAIKSID